jgi:uncharacterized membrane protein
LTQSPNDREPEVVRLSPATRRQIRLQITLPLLLGVVVLAGLALAMYTVGFGGVGVWADVSLVLLILPLLLVGLLALILTSAVLFALVKVGGWLLPPLRKAQVYVDRAEQMARRGMDITARPMIMLHGVGAGLARIMRGVRIRKRDVEG